MSLTDTAVRNLKPSDKPYKLADGGGMYLHVTPNGGKYWRLAFRLHGKQKIYALGVYPQVSLAEARQTRDEAKKLIKQGIDPVVERKQTVRRKSEEQATTFELIAREWHKTKRSAWTESHAKKIMNSLEADIFPKLGDRSISSITAPDLLMALRVIEKRGALEIAGRVLQRCNAVFRYAVATGRIVANPAAELRGALKTPERKHHAALSHDELPEFLAKLAGYDGDPQTRLGLQLMVHTFVRTGELRAASWAEFNLELSEWRIPAERMKMREEHIVPLSKQAVALLRQLQAVGGGSDLVFPSGNGRRNKWISENTLLYALYRLGYHSRATGHGFRATASTILNEMGFHPDWIERQLAHAERNKVRAAYNRALYLAERRRMMQIWSDYLDIAAGGKEVVLSDFRRNWTGN